MLKKDNIMKKGTIAMVGGGKGGAAILKALIKVPDIEIKYVCDIDPNAKAFDIAREHGIGICTDNYAQIRNNDEIDIIFEITGNPDVLNDLTKIKSSKTTLIGPVMAEVIFHLLDSKNKVTEDLEEHKHSLEEKIRHRTIQLEKKIHEYEKLNEKLQEINDEKTKYLLKATHQLKAPFAAIQSYTDVIMEGFTGGVNKETFSIMNKIKIRCDLLSKSIKEMLELANLKSCIYNNLIFKEIGIKMLLSPIIELNNTNANIKNILIKFDKKNNEYLIKCCKEQLTILFSILIENAINYSYENGVVDVKVIEDDSNYEIHIQDYGIGIPEKNLNKIFSEYFRSNNAVEHNNNGTGLGLAIAKEIAVIHGYQLQVVSEIEKGTTFKVVIPKKEKE